MIINRAKETLKIEAEAIKAGAVKDILPLTSIAGKMVALIGRM